MLVLLNVFCLLWPNFEASFDFAGTGIFFLFLLFFLFHEFGTFGTSIWDKINEKATIDVVIKIIKSLAVAAGVPAVWNYLCVPATVRAAVTAGYEWFRSWTQQGRRVTQTQQANVNGEARALLGHQARQE